MPTDAAAWSPAAGGRYGGVVYRELHESVRERLAELERRAATSASAKHAGVEHTVSTADELPKLIAALRALLEAHQPDARGHCRTCRGKLRFRRTPAPCRAYLSTYLCLILSGEGAP